MSAAWIAAPPLLRVWFCEAPGAGGHPRPDEAAAGQMKRLRMFWLTMSSSETVMTTTIRIALACE